MPLSLPNKWLWDIIDEFVYQFQSFCQYRANPSKRGPGGDIEDLDVDLDSIWNLYPVINILCKVISKVPLPCPAPVG